jgi:predicted MFS family arabinose efflux permease
LAQDAAAAIREIGRHPFLRALVWFLILWSGVVGAIGALTGIFLLRTLHIPVSVYGLLFAFTGLAGIAGSAVGGRAAGNRSSYPVLALLGFGGGIIATMLLPMAGGPLPAVATLAVLGIALPVLCGAVANIGLTGVMVNDVPEPMLGRVLGTLRTATTVVRVPGALLGGVLGDAFGIRSALWVCCVAALASLVLTIPAMRAVRTRRAAVPLCMPASSEVGA